MTVDFTRSLCTDELKKCGCVCVRVVMSACIYRRKTFGIFVERHVQFSRRAHVVAPNASIYKFILYTLFVCSVYYFTFTPFSKRECVHLQYDFFPNESRLYRRTRFICLGVILVHVFSYNNRHHTFRRFDFFPIHLHR